MTLFLRGKRRQSFHRHETSVQRFQRLWNRVKPALRRRCFIICLFLDPLRLSICLSRSAISLSLQPSLLISWLQHRSATMIVIKLPEVACLHAYRITHRSQHVCMHTISCIFQLCPSKGRLGGSDESLMSFKNFCGQRKLVRFKSIFHVKETI
jgi:hypothetical protein